MDFISRDDWHARPPKRPFTRLRSSRVVGIVVHHSGVVDPPQGVTAVRAYERYHMDTRGWNAVAYNWLVDENGVIYEGRGSGIVSGATKHYNFKTESICYTGFGGKKIPEPALIGISEVIADIQSRYGGKLWLKGHKDLSSTACPGTELHAWLVNGCVLYAGNPSTIDFEGIARFFRELGVVLDAKPLSRLRRSRGEMVRWVQARLRDKGYDPGPVDGVFGAKTRLAVKDFQTNLGILRKTGAVDRSTWDALFLL
ncbi:MAG: N-acetylmuramoyl-L-alanine amidase [SAR202 cluster bacterium]|nr:N-acetylmuramoyl-L-alanine amidase [SAR202 cluster bacterium]